MDKNEYKVRLEEIKTQIDQENYEEAAALADQIEWKKVRNVNTLCMISEVYEAVGRYEDSKVILLRAYRRSPMSRTVLYRLVEVTIALRQFDEAIGYYTEYVQSAPNDTNRYILKYEIYRGRGSSVNEQIDILKEYLDQEYNEKYAYELAKLYREADRMQECIAACDDLVLWFHSGKYVIKALELKRKYAALTPKQQEIYDGRYALEDEERELEEFGQEKQMVGTDATTLADSIIEDTEKAIAEEVAKAARAGQEEELQVLEQIPAQKAEALAWGAEQTGGGAAEALSEEAEQIGAGVAEALREETEQIGGGAAEALSEESEQIGGGAAEALSEESEQIDAGAAKALSEEAQETEQIGGGAAEALSEETQAEQEQIGAEKSEAEDAFEEQEAQPQEGDAQTAEMARETAAPVRVKSKEELQTDIARDMHEIIGSVGRLEYVDETAQAMDDLIEESKKGQAMEREKSTLRMPTLRMPDLQAKQAAGKLTIDDILLSMGERGDAVREAAAKASPYSQGSPGVLSAVDEALLNMGILPEENGEKAGQGKTEEDAPDTKSTGTGRREHAAFAMTEIRVDPEPEKEVEEGHPREEKSSEADIENASRQLQEAFSEDVPENRNVPGAEPDGEKAENENGSALAQMSDEPDVRQANVKHGTLTDDDLREALRAQAGETSEESFRDKTMEEIINARTRRIPTEKIAALYGRRPLEPDHSSYGQESAYSQNSEENTQQGTHSGDAGSDAGRKLDEAGSIPEETYEPRTEDVTGDGSGNAGDAGNSPEGEKTGRESSGTDVSDASKSDAAAPVTQNSESETSGAEGMGKEDAQPAANSAVARGPILKDDLRELFEGFLNVRGMETQIVNAIRQTLTKGNDRTSRTGNILIFGSHGSGKTTLAMALSKAIAQERGQEYVKMARIYSTDLNRKDIAATVAKIAGGVLIVEEAGDLDDSIADQLTTAMEFRTDGLVVILEDEQAYIHDLLLRHPRLTMKFTSEIYIPAYTAQELAGFGEVYADSLDFALSDGAREVLTERVSAMMRGQENGQPLSINAVKEVMDKAMAKASGFGRKLFGGKKRYDELGRVILREKDI